jgi:putative ABC transport system ATP-binding protein
VHPDVREIPLEVERVSLLRGGSLVLDGIDAAFQRGVVTGITGPSGAGKTSLLRCLNRLEDPAEGRVLLDGSDIRSIDPTVLRRRVGMIFQTPSVFEGGVRANLCYGLDEPEEDVLIDVLQACGLDGSYLSRDSTALSVGQAQRVCIARALVRDPEVLLMDEPTSALDKDAANRVEGLLGDLTSRGLAIVLVTHNLAQAERVAEWSYLLVDGRVVMAGTPKDIHSAWPDEVTR